MLRREVSKSCLKHSWTYSVRGSLTLSYRQLHWYVKQLSVRGVWDNHWRLDEETWKPPWDGYVALFRLSSLLRDSSNRSPCAVIATKFTTCYKLGPNRPHIAANYTGNGTKSLNASVEASLKKLQTDYIDVVSYSAKLSPILHFVC